MAHSEEYKYEAFISYRRSDGTAAARWLRQKLLHYRAPKELAGNYPTKLRLYLDTIYERATDDFFEKNIKPSIAKSRYLIVLCTPDSIKARSDGSPNWVAREVEYFMGLRHGGNMIPVLAGDAEGGVLPAIQDAYANIEVIDLRLYSRLSWCFPRRFQLLNDELLKIIATILGVPDDQMPTLRREEQRRRQTRARLFGAIGIGILALLASLVISATLSLVQATRQLVQNHTLQGQELFDSNPSAARLHFAEAVKTADALSLHGIGLGVDAGLARLWLGQYNRAAPPVVFWHGAAITAAALSADGQRLATGTLNGVVRLWDTRTGQQISAPMHHGDHIECVTFSRDATLISSAGRDKRAIVWRVPPESKWGSRLSTKTT